MSRNVDVNAKMMHGYQVGSAGGFGARANARDIFSRSCGMYGKQDKEGLCDLRQISVVQGRAKPLAQGNTHCGCGRFMK